MPELPEVETTRRGIAPHVTGRHVSEVIVREPRLRWPVSPELEFRLRGQCIDLIERRAKYLLFRTATGGMILHLGMSGSLRIVEADTAAQPHDHIDIVLSQGQTLRLRDPRRFGAVLWSESPLDHPLLRPLGPEPFDPAFTGSYLRRRAHGRKLAIKEFIMNSHIVAGIGNIYANEALYQAGIHPARAAGRIGAERMQRLSETIRAVLTTAIECGGTTLRDFVHEDGQPGYFRPRLLVYDQAGRACSDCGGAIRQIVQGQRSTYYCTRCQH